MGYKKLVRFEAIKGFANVLEYPQDMNGKWSSFFKNDHPITLELACGKGEYTLGLALMHPDANFIGIDIKGNRIWAGATKALAQNLPNAAFVRSQIEMLPTYFRAGEIKDIWITFPDPQLRTSRAKKRLTHPRFLRLYQQIMGADGIIHLKTDSPDLYRFTLKVIALYGLSLFDSTEDLYARTGISDALQIRTYYESLDIAGSRKVHYLQFRLDKDLENPDKAAALKEMLAQGEYPLGEYQNAVSGE